MTQTTHTTIDGEARQIVTCDHRRDGWRCTRRVAYRLLGPDGDRVPGGPICRECAVEIVSEYRAKLGEQWKLLAYREET